MNEGANAEINQRVMRQGRKVRCGKEEGKGAMRQGRRKVQCGKEGGWQSKMAMNLATKEGAIQK